MEEEEEMERDEHEEELEELDGEEVAVTTAGTGTVTMDVFKVARLKRNRTDLEVNSQARVLVCSVKSCHAIFKEAKNLEFHMTCHNGMQQ